MKITLTLDQPVVNAIVGVLQKLPYEQVAATIQEIQRQTEEQLKLQSTPQ